MKFLTTAIIAIMISIFWTGCSTDPGVPLPTTNYGKATFRINLTSQNQTRGIGDVKKIQIIANQNNIKQFDQVYDYANQTSFTCQIPVGTGYIFTINALTSNDAVEFTGNSSIITITKDTTTDVDIVLEPPKTGVEVGGIIHEITGPPTIKIDTWPEYGVWGTPVKGTVTNISPESAKIVTWILVRGDWWPKPYSDTPFTTIGPDGKFQVNITTGGVDEEATEIRVYLVTNDFSDTSNLPPAPPTTQVLSMDFKLRTAP